MSSEGLPGSNLNRRRYAQNDETLYVAPEDDRTDYVGAYYYQITMLLLLTVRSVTTTDEQLV